MAGLFERRRQWTENGEVEVRRSVEFVVRQRRKIHQYRVEDWWRGSGDVLCPKTVRGCLLWPTV